MRLGDDGYFGLTYCTNIHPAQGWPAVFGSLEQYAPALKARLSPDAPFGIGLRLSGIESRELLAGDNLERFAEWLREQGLYVFTLNGFPYGAFHGTPVKADVHAPDWRDEERVAYSIRLATILKKLLPEGMDGSISTSPLAYKSWVDQDDRDTWQLLARNVARVAEALQSSTIHLDLEPEPDGLLERSSELVRFFEEWLPRRAWEHVGVCFDTCHMAVAHEDPAEVMDRYARAGISIGKIQVSSALEVPLPAARQALEAFADPVYLHQVTQKNRDGSLRQYPDLPEALQQLNDPNAEQWRIHFHTPLFVERYGSFRSTRDWIERTFDEVKRRRNCRILEIETYTWDVLPPELKQDLTDSIAREYEWVMDTLALPAAAAAKR
ncbi:MAG TPA: metabolite traffic protein EboE [Chloroflexota bacterium]|jgi:sugar phosphate isomerase/epimerase